MRKTDIAVTAARARALLEERIRTVLPGLRASRLRLACRVAQELFPGIILEELMWQHSLREPRTWREAVRYSETTDFFGKLAAAFATQKGEALTGRRGMSKQQTVYYVWISAPSDAKEYVRVARDTLDQWNREQDEYINLRLQHLYWAEDTHPAIGKRPQQVINDQLESKADILVAIFASKLGTPTGRAPSGTVEEITRAASQGKPTLLYFAETSGSRKQQRTRLQQYRKQVSGQALFKTFASKKELENVLRRDLPKVVRALEAQEGVPTPKPIQTYLARHPNLVNKAELASQCISTSRASFFDAAQFILDSLGSDHQVFAVDNLNIGREYNLYWITEGVPYLKMNWRAATRGVSVHRAFLVERKELAKYGEYVNAIRSLHERAGATTSVVIYEDLPDQYREEFVLWGSKYVDVVRYDIRAHRVVANTIHWGEGEYAKYHRYAQMVKVYALQESRRGQTRARTESSLDMLIHEMKGRFSDIDGND
ncbi:MAG: hypothetical protein HS108_14510 [Planctomycetes bacterium]|nr:hypothetical protein [Planctomycetota bacterium]